ncbi:MAG: antitoxin family protein [Nitrospirota bacterium]
MLITIRGLYEEGIVKPLEKVDIKGKAEVMITFLDTPKWTKSVFISAAGSWKDMDTEELKKQIYESRMVSTRREVRL